MSQQNLQDKIGPWLALFHVPNLSLSVRHQLLQYLDSPAEILASSRAELSDLGLKSAAIDAIQGYQQNPQSGQISQALEADLTWVKQPGRSIICYGDSGYPPQLREIPSAPLVLYVVGDPVILQQPQIAMVGSRIPSVIGNDTAKAFAKHLARAGITVTSGLAVGIDGACHLGALEGGGNTIAVMATGIDKLYPRRHRALAKNIAQQGALVSEFPLGTPPRPSHFPQRNRLISGLSLGVLVVEAALKSGSLITAKCALSQNREVFAVPGSIHNPMSKGCHALIRQGAKLVETTEDILEEIRHILPDRVSTVCQPKPDSAVKTELDSSAAKVFKLIGFDVVGTDALMMHADLTISELTQQLIRLELLDYIKAVDGGFIRNINCELG